MPGCVMGNDINIRSASFLLARTVGTCRRCRAPTAVFGLAVPPGHEVLDDEALDHEGSGDESRDEKLAGAAWQIAPYNAFLFDVEYLPVVVQARLKSFTQSYHLRLDDAAKQACWANHCEECGCPQDDHELFCEPEGAFLPVSESAAAAIHLLSIDEAFEAAAAGYAYEPEFFDAMSQE